MLQLDLEIRAAILLQEPLGQEQPHQLALAELEKRQAEILARIAVAVAAAVELQRGLQTVAQKNDVALHRPRADLQLAGQRAGVGPTAAAYRTIDRRNPRQRTPRWIPHDWSLRILEEVADLPLEGVQPIFHARGTRPYRQLLVR
jgi:hypothetical protein